MKVLFKSGIAALLSIALAASARAELIEQQVDVPVKVTREGQASVEQPIKVTVFHDSATPSPRPVLVLNHGHAGRAADRQAMGRVRMAKASRWFASQGFLVVVPTRIGYGVSGGSDLETADRCDELAFSQAFDAAAQEVSQVLAAVQSRPDAMAERSVIVGQSFGGATTVAVAARNPSGVIAAINFAGGTGSQPNKNPDHPCSPEAMQAIYAAWGRTARAPMLWAYAQNDHHWGPTIPSQWVAAFREAGGTAEFIEFPPHGAEGHRLFDDFPAVWEPVVAQFLKERGFAISADVR